MVKPIGYLKTTYISEIYETFPLIIKKKKGQAKSMKSHKNITGKLKYIAGKSCISYYVTTS